MKIIYLAAGAANMYCGSCLRDNTLVAALRKAGHDALLIPTYTPIRTDEADVSEKRIFFGGINVYLQQKASIFRYTPWFLDKLLDSPRLIRRLAARSSSIDATALGDLTVSMIHGEEGNQRKEVEKLVQWLEFERPDVVHLSNAMMIGVARRIAERVNVPVFCTLSGEDIFLEKIPEPHYSAARQALRERARDVQAYVAMNRYYGDYMRDYMGLQENLVHVVPPGLNLDGHGTRVAAEDGTVTVGYLARICHEKGLHHLIEAFKLLCDDQTLPPLKLRVAGYRGAADEKYYRGIEKRVKELGLIDRYAYLGELNRNEKLRFLQSLDVMTVPTVYRESKGLSPIEALANAVPVVLPEHGAFPELIKATGGGLLFEPDDPAALADQLKRLILDRDLAEELGQRGQDAVRRLYSAEVMAQRTVDLYQALLSNSLPGKVDTQVIEESHATEAASPGRGQHR